MSERKRIYWFIHSSYCQFRTVCLISTLSSHSGLLFPLGDIQYFNITDTIESTGLLTNANTWIKGLLSIFQSSSGSLNPINTIFAVICSRLTITSQIDNSKPHYVLVYAANNSLQLLLINHGAFCVIPTSHHILCLILHFRFFCI